MSRRRFRPALLGALLLSACLTPTDGSGRFGEARVRPEFAADNAPEDMGVNVDSIRTVLERADGTTLINAMRPYQADAEQAWIIELQSVADDVDVTIELLVGSSVAYRGARVITVSEGTAGRSPVEAVPVSYIATDIAARVVVTPDDVAFGSIGATRQLQATVYDPHGIVLNNKTVTWASVNDGVASVDDDGLVTAAGLGITSITASVDGVSGAATVFVDTALARTSTITADSTSIAADGVASTQISVRILDANGQPIGASAGTVSLAATLGTLGSVTDHADGTYTATLVAGTTAGSARISGTLDGKALSDSAVVEFRPLTGDPGTTTITADSAALNADGVSSTMVRVRVLDAQGNLVGASAGVVALTTTLGTLGSVTDHADGSYSATLTAGTTAGTAIISGTLNGAAITDTAGVVLRAVASPTTTSITADSSAMDADGVSSTLVTVRVLDAHGNPVGSSAGVVTLASTLGTTSSAVTDHADGTYTATLRAGVTAGLAVVSGTLNGVAIGDTAGVQLRPLADVTTTTITADSAAIDADGVSSTLVTVRVLDGSGHPRGASAGVVTLTSTLGTGLSAVTDHADGTYTATLTAGTTAGLAIISGTLDGVAITDTAGVMLRALPDPTTTSITADSAAMNADGVSGTLVTVRVLDSQGSPIGASAGVVTLSSALGTTLSAVTDHADGTYTATLTAGTTPGLAVVSGTLSGAPIADTAGVQLRALPDPTTTTITADSAALNADGVSTTLVTVRVLDVNGMPVGASAGVVTLASPLGNLSEVTDHADGSYTATLTAGTVAGLAVITGALDGTAITDTAGVMLRALPDPTTTTITADSAALDADGMSTTQVTVRVLDVHGNPIGASAGVVTLTSTLGTTLSAVTDHADGSYTASLRAGTTAGLAIISGALNGGAITDTAGVVLRALPDPTTTSITADSAAIDADGVSSTLVTVRMLDRQGNPRGVSGGQVLLATTLGTLTAVTDHADGTYSATLTAGTVAGLAIISGTLEGVAISDTAGVHLRAVPDPTTTTITADSAALNADGMSSTRVIVRVLDVNGMPVGASAGVVTLTSTLGTVLSAVTDHADGTYTATLTAGTVAGHAIITGTLAGAPIAHADTVVLRPVASPITTTITADSTSIVADGKSATMVTVRVLDINGVPIGRSAGVVTLATTRGILSAIVDHQDGTYTATLRADTTPPDGGEFSASLVVIPFDTAVVTGTLNGAGIADSARVEFRPPSGAGEGEGEGITLRTTGRLERNVTVAGDAWTRRDALSLPPWQSPGRAYANAGCDASNCYHARGQVLASSKVSPQIVAAALTMLRES